MNTFPNPLSNRLLAALPPMEWHDLVPQLEYVELSAGQVLSMSESAPTHVYFPTTAIISLLTVMENGVSTEVSVVGNEGVFGLPLFLSGESTTSAVVRSAGVAFRLDANDAQIKFRATPWPHLLLRYTQTLMAQISQTVTCHEHHSLDQQLCRWLLVSLDRLPTKEFLLTQDHIAHVLGVCRESVAEIILKLQKAGLIGYMHGRISVIYRAGLEKRVCECYGSGEAEYARRLPPIKRPHVEAMEYTRMYA